MSFTAKQDNLVPSLKNNAEKTAKLIFLHPGFLKIKFELFGILKLPAVNLSCAPVQCTGGDFF